jgi:hypothetical protein
MTEIIQFAPRVATPVEISLESVELRLQREGESCKLQMTLYDRDCGVIDVLVFQLVSRPRYSILDLLCAAWERWRGDSAGLVS